MKKIEMIIVVLLFFFTFCNNTIAESKDPETDIKMDWIILEGKWEITRELVRYLGPKDPKSSENYGLILYKGRVWNGTIETTINFTGKLKSAKIVFSYNPVTKSFYTAGLGRSGNNYSFKTTELGGEPSAFALEYYRHDYWESFYIFRNLADLTPETDYHTKILIEGDKVTLIVNEVKLITSILPVPMFSDQVGIFVDSSGRVEFKNTKLNAKVLY